MLVIRELLEQKMATAQIRRVVDHLRRTGYKHPLTELRFAVLGNEIFFQHPDGQWEGAKRRSQIVFHQVLDLHVLRAKIWDSVENPRSNHAKGLIEQRRRVQGHRKVFSETRVPVDSVIRYIERGIPEREILEAFPSLSRADIRAAKGEARLAAV